MKYTLCEEAICERSSLRNSHSNHFQSLAAYVIRHEIKQWRSS